MDKLLSQVKKTDRSHLLIVPCVIFCFYAQYKPHEENHLKMASNFSFSS